MISLGMFQAGLGLGLGLKCREGLRMLLLYHYQLFTVHHSSHYNLVSLIFGTTIPTSFNILNEMFLYTL